MPDFDLMSQVPVLIITIASALVSITTQSGRVYRLGLVALLVAGLALFVIVFLSQDAVWAKVIVVAIGLAFTAYLCWGLYAARRTMSVGRMNKEIMRRTKNVATSSTIRIFGGDLDFFGEFIPGNNSAGIATNDSFLQLKDLGNTRNVSVEVMCCRPKKASEKLRIGYLAENLPNAHFAFYTDNDNDCDECEIEDFCADVACDKERICKSLRKRCPDLRFRARMLTGNNSANYVLVTNWIDRDRLYERLIVFEPDSRESRFYMDLWELLWQNAKLYEAWNCGIVNKCTELLHKEMKTWMNMDGC